MEIFVTLGLSFAVIGLVIFGMSIGVIAGREPIKGSCGGLNGAGCELCGDDSNRCKDAEAS